MSDTPRTDAYYEKWQESWSREPISLDLCRQLERELAEAREQLKANHKGCELLERMVYEAREQRDTLAEAIEFSLSRALACGESESRLRSALAAVKGGDA
jgi:hypothetical protein